MELLLLDALLTPWLGRKFGIFRGEEGGIFGTLREYSLTEPWGVCLVFSDGVKGRFSVNFVLTEIAEISRSTHYNEEFKLRLRDGRIFSVQTE